MSDAPERILIIDADGHDVAYPDDGTYDLPHAKAKYIRADVVAELVEALEQCRDELDAHSLQEYPSDHPVHQRYRARDYESNTARIALAKAKGNA